MSSYLKRYWYSLQQNAVLKVITAFEILILLVMLANCFRSRCDYIFDVETMFAGEDYVQYLTEDGELTGYTVYMDENIAETTVVYTDYFRLYPGAYRISLNYTSQVNYDEKESTTNGNGYFYLESENNSAYFYFASVFLNNGAEKAEQTVQIRSLWSLDDLNLKVTYYGLGELTVYSAEVTEILAYRYICFFGLLFAFFFWDFAGYLIFIDEDFPYTKELGALIIICLAALLPLATDYTYIGHDTGFHINRIGSLAWELSNGKFFSAVYSNVANGYGYAVPLFYCPFFLYLPAILYNCGFSLTFVYNFYLCIMSVATCLIMYYCALKIINNHNCALMAAAMYTFGGPRLTAIFTRGAMGDVTAQTFFPLIILGFYSVYTIERGKKITIRKYWPIIVGLTGVVASHALSTVMSAMIIAAFCVVFWKRTFERQRFLALVKAAILTVLMNLAVLVPMLDSMSMDMVLTNGIQAHIQTHGAYLIQIMNSILNNFNFSSEAGTVSADMSLSLGFATVIGLLLFPLCRAKELYMYNLHDTLYCSAEENVSSELTEKKDNFASVCWWLSVLMIFLSSIYMFYDYLDFLPSPIYSVLTMYQFPWRWLSYASLFGVLSAASILERAENLSVFGKIPVVSLLCLALIINIGQVYSDTLREINLNSYSSFNNMDIGGGGEYLLNETDLTQLSYQDLIYDMDRLLVGGYRTYDGRQFLYDVENTSDETATVDIPLFHYDNYAAYDEETGEEIAITNGSNNRIQLHIPAGYSGTIEIRYEIPLLWKLAVTVSVVTDILLIAYAVLQNRNARMIKGEVQ